MSFTFPVVIGADGVSFALMGTASEVSRAIGRGDGTRVKRLTRRSGKRVAATS